MFQTKGYPVELLFNENRMGKQLTSKPVERMQSTSSDSQTSWSEYEAFTDVVLNKLLEEHKLFSSDHHKTQLDIIKNYLWLAAIIASAIGAVLATKSFKFSELSLCDALSLSALTVAALLACFAFIKGTRLLLGERGGLRPVVAPSYYELLCEAYGDDESGKPFAVKQNWIRELEGAVQYMRDIHSEKGKKIRDLNLYLVTSAALGLAGATVSFLADHY